MLLITRHSLPHYHHSLSPFSPLSGVFLNSIVAHLSLNSPPSRLILTYPHSLQLSNHLTLFLPRPTNGIYLLPHFPLSHTATVPTISIPNPLHLSFIPPLTTISHQTPLSFLLFLFSVNSLSHVAPILLDLFLSRIPLISVSFYFLFFGFTIYS